MQLLDVDKVRYRSHIKRVIVMVIAVLMAGSLTIAQVLITFFPAAQGTHFHWNLIGVTATAIVVLVLLRKYKTHPYMFEVAYVWDLKQALNQVIRKMTKLNAAAQQGREPAFQALKFFYEGSRQLANLDDNAIALEELEIKHHQLQRDAEAHGVILDAGAYKESYVRSL
ncbi:MAG: DUF3087 family protein [Marinagarivorans sp.]|nr:DUF3087 family protein [Marinagarivorans sp.]